LLKKTICVLVAIVCLSSGALTRAQAPQAEEKPATFDERLGDDDGAALAILFGANSRGNLEMCDCTQPRGGLSRRVGYVEGFKKKFKQTPVIQVEAGHFTYDSTGYTPAIMLQNEQVMRAYSRWPIDVINLGRYDLIFAQKLLARDGLAERTTALPMIKNLISANGVFDSTVVAPRPYIIKEVTGPRIKGKKSKIKVGFIGLAEPKRMAEGVDLTVKDMFDAARKIVPQARKESDVLVIVSHSGRAAALRLAEENPTVDVIITGGSEGLYKPRQIGNTLVVFAAPGNTQEGDLRFYIDAEGHISFKFRSPELDAVVPSDPAANTFVEAARSERARGR
jgi:2',3'-cyclic-nucleotide 2'-phosphodiesterase (5'-nucleotidase family)